MLYHPTTISLLSVLVLALVYHWDKIFWVIAIVYPLVLLRIIFTLEGRYTYEIMNMHIIANFEDYTILISYAFTAMLFVANLYAIGNHKKQEIILGSSYGGLAYMALFAGDMISLIIALELMMVVSSFMIFIGGQRRSMRSAKKYFLTHLMSGNMIIIGICYLIMKTGSTEIINLASLMNNQEYSSLILAIMLTGLVMNVASFPFSGWMVNYYPDASASGFIYLISFTTKVSVIILLKLFAGYEALKYIAIIMIIYSSIKAVLENNLFSTLCLLSIIQMGFMMIATSMAGDMHHDDWMQHVVASYLFFHILYKGLLSLSVAAIVDHGKIVNCNDLKRIKNPTILFALLVGITAMINIPLSSTFITKSYVSHLFLGDPIYFIIIFLGMMTVITVPWRRYFNSHETIILHLNMHIKLAIYFLGLTVFIVTFFAHKIPFISEIPTFSKILLFSADSMKQITIIAVAIAIAMLLKRPRIHSNATNLTEILGDILFYLYSYFDGKKHETEEKEKITTETVTHEFLIHARMLHNQQTAIFIVFTIFIIMLLTFIVRGI